MKVAAYEKEGEEEEDDRVVHLSRSKYLRYSDP